MKFAIGPRNSGFRRSALHPSLRVSAILPTRSGESSASNAAAASASGRRTDTAAEECRRGRRYFFSGARSSAGTRRWIARRLAPAPPTASYDPGGIPASGWQARRHGDARPARTRQTLAPPLLCSATLPQRTGPQPPRGITKFPDQPQDKTPDRQNGDLPRHEKQENHPRRLMHDAAPCCRWATSQQKISAGL